MASWRRRSWPSDVKDGIGRSGTAPYAVQVFQIAAMDISARCGQKPGARVAARKTKYLVTCADQFRDNPGADESCWGNNVFSGAGGVLREFSIWWFSRDVLVFLPSCHGASTLRHK